jgi:hypothetical protein
MKVRDHKEVLDVDGKMVLKWMLAKDGGRLWTGFIWLRTRTSDGLL